MVNILLLSGGGGSEHDISLLSAQYLRENLIKIPNVNLVDVLIDNKLNWIYQNQACSLTHAKELVVSSEKKIKIDYAVPCLHGFPGETGDIQSLFELYKIPYLGCNAESSRLCFNKVSTKLWLDALKIPNTPWMFITRQSKNIKEKVANFFTLHQSLFIKASSQGSSVGCYPLDNINEIDTTLEKAFKYSEQVLIEKKIIARELEVSVFEYKGEIHCTLPGEIITPGGFYDFDQKYSKTSHTQTQVIAKNLEQVVIDKIQAYAINTFKWLNLKDLSRIDFFLDQTGNIYLNEINSFPGMTPISMFPKMMEAYGVTFQDFIRDRILGILGARHFS
jgi:D-alanine-D-alanine ligase